MNKLAILLFVLLLPGCALFKPKPVEICTPKEPLVQYQYNLLPDYLVAPCPRPEPFKDPITLESLAKELDKRKGDQNLCADRMDAIRQRNETYKKANEQEASP